MSDQRDDDELTAAFQAQLEEAIEHAAAKHAAATNEKLDQVIAQNERLIQMSRALLFSLKLQMPGETDA